MAEDTKIALEKSCDISKVEQLHEKLEAALERACNVEIDASAVERIDTSTLQLLYSFMNTMSKHHLDMRLINPSRYFRDTAHLMGLAGQLRLIS